MFLAGIGVATPEHRYTKSECWDAFLGSEWITRLSPRSRAITKAVLQQENGIEARYLALDTINDVFAIDPDTLHRRFAKHAPCLAADAAAAALERAHLAASDIDAVIVSTCTGYLCPGLSGYVGERLQLRKDIHASTCSPFAARSAVPPCTWTTIRACSSAPACSAMGPALPFSRGAAPTADASCNGKPRRP